MGRLVEQSEDKFTTGNGVGVFLGFAFGEDEIALTLAREALPIVIPIYAQGVVFDGTAIQATEVAVMKLEPWSDG